MPKAQQEITWNNLKLSHFAFKVVSFKIVINDLFAFKVAFGFTINDDEIESQTVKKYRHRNDWAMWKEAIQTKLNSLTKCKVFGPIVYTPKDVMHVGYK